MRTFKAVMLNIIYPGTGYLYLKDSFRKQIAIFLVSIWTFFLCAVAYELVKALITGNFYLLTGSDTQIPVLAVLMWVAMSLDTFFLARGKKTKRQNRQIA